MMQKNKGLWLIFGEALNKETSVFFELFPFCFLLYLNSLLNRSTIVRSKHEESLVKYVSIHRKERFSIVSHRNLVLSRNPEMLRKLYLFGRDTPNHDSATWFVPVDWFCVFLDGSFSETYQNKPLLLDFVSFFLFSQLYVAHFGCQAIHFFFFLSLSQQNVMVTF